ncbi:MAG: methyltransferase domain-containing protein [Gaiellaceae bacterium]
MSLHGIRERLKPLVPPRVRRQVNRATFTVVGVALRGDAVHCSCCGRSYRRFVDYPSPYCPGCGAYERHRLLCLYLDRHPELLAGDVLQVGPEATVIARYAEDAHTWLSVDLDPAHPLADRVMDVMDLALEDASFDLVLCAHVLDVVADRDVAVRELHRVTRPGGTALIQSPRRDFPKGPDEYALQLSAQGFGVTVARLPEQQDDHLRRRFGLDGEPIFNCLRPA